MADIGLLLIRLPVGILFLLAGSGKIHAGVGAFAHGMISHVPGWMPQPLGWAYLYALPWMESLVGVSMILGAAVRAFGVIASLMLLSFMIAVTGFKPAPNSGPLQVNLIYLGVVLGIALCGAGRISVDGMCCCRGKKAETAAAAR